MTTRKEVEAAIGAIITAFNDVEVALIDILEGLIGDFRKGEIIGWTLGFNDKVKIIKKLAEGNEKLINHWRLKFDEAIAETESAADMRNQVAHGQLWANPEDDGYSIRKGKKGATSTYKECDIEKLKEEAIRLSNLADKLRGLAAVFIFDDLTKSPTD